MIFETTKRKAFQEFKALRELRDANERILYGWVDLEVLSIPSIIGEEHLRSYKECP